MITSKTFSIENRLLLIKKTVCFFFIIGIISSFKLWISNRFFPLAPILDDIPIISSPFDSVLAIALIVLLGFNILNYKRSMLSILLVILLVLGIQDQMRWQPWAYLYMMILICFLSNKQENWVKSELLSCIQFILAGVYIWSGIHKLNSNFIDFTFHSLLTDFLKIKDFSLINNFKKFAYIIPALEIFIGVALLVPSIRNLGVYLATLAHIFILLYLSPLGINSNSVVYPWNVAMMVLLYLLFYNVKNKLQIGINENIKLKVFNLSVAILIWTLPILNFYGYWDNYLSFSLYSDKNKDYYIALEETELEKIDKRLKPYFINMDGMKGGEIIDLNKWSLAELNVPFYPQRRVFKKISKTFCYQGISNEKVIFLEFERPLTIGKFYRFTCKDLLKK